MGPIFRMGKGPLSVAAEDFQEWQKKVTDAITLVFGENSHYIDDFNEIRFTDIFDHLSEKKTGIWKGLVEARKTLQAMIDEINETEGNSALPAGKTGNAVSADPRTVFVVHGRNLGRRDAMFRFLRSIGLSPLEWSQAVKATGKASPYIGEVLDAAFSRAQAVVVLLTPDDKAYLRRGLRRTEDPAFESQLTYQARPNVLFEAGMAMGRSAERTVLIQIGELRPFSDIAGRHVLKLDNSTERRQELALRLESAGCSVDLSGTQWHREGDFNIFSDLPVK